MRFQDLLITTTSTLADELAKTREERGQILLLIEELATRPVMDTKAELLYHMEDGKEWILFVQQGTGKAIDFLSWDIILGCSVDVSYLEKQTTHQHFINLVLRHMTYEGLNETKRAERIEQIRTFYPFADCDAYSWYEMKKNIRVKNGVLRKGEKYARQTLFDAGVRPCELVEQRFATLW